MRFTRIGMLAAAFFLTTLAASAQLETTPQQWTIVTTKESAPNAYPLLDANGNPYSCNGQNVDNPKDSNSNCYNPLVITTDWTLTSEFGIAVGLSTALPDTFTNSNCSNSGGVVNANVTGYDIFGFYQATFTVTLDNGATITFTGSPSVRPEPILRNISLHRFMHEERFRTIHRHSVFRGQWHVRRLLREFKRRPSRERLCRLQDRFLLQRHRHHHRRKKCQSLLLHAHHRHTSRKHL